MGKSQKKLTNALKEHNDNLNKKYGDSVDISLSAYVSSSNVFEENMNLCTDHIYDDLLQYVRDDAFPLCEFLDKRNICNYIRWVLKTPQF